MLVAIAEKNQIETTQSFLLKVAEKEPRLNN